MQVASPDFSSGECEQVSTHDCTAHSAEYTPGSNAIRSLFVFTDTWCSSGQFAPDGTLIQTGGDSDGFAKVAMPGLGRL